MTDREGAPAPRPIQKQLDLDLALLATMTFRCADHDCGKIGAALDGGWVLVKLGDGVLVYCTGCAAPAGGS